MRPRPGELTEILDMHQIATGIIDLRIEQRVAVRRKRQAAGDPGRVGLNFPDLPGREVAVVDLALTPLIGWREEIENRSFRRSTGRTDARNPKSPLHLLR